MPFLLSQSKSLLFDGPGSSFSRIFGLQVRGFGGATIAKKAFLFNDAIYEIRNHVNPIVSAILDGIQCMAAENGKDLWIIITDVSDALVGSEVIIKRLESRVNWGGCGSPQFPGLFVFPRVQKDLEVS